MLYPIELRVRSRMKAKRSVRKVEFCIARDLKMLQWGRARAGAELSRASDRSISAFRRFNGAAPARARSCVSPRRARRFWRMLQWGRARAGAELRFTAPGATVLENASMGPRPRGRGVVWECWRRWW